MTHDIDGRHLFDVILDTPSERKKTTKRKYGLQNTKFYVFNKDFAPIETNA